MHIEIKQHFQLDELPFEQTPNLRFFCDFDLYRDTLDAVVLSIEKGEPIIKIVGEVGTGKTLLCRKLIALLDEKGMITLYIHNPLLSTDTLLRLIADELDIFHESSDTEYSLYKKMTQKLIAYYNQNKKVVLLIDEAHTLSDAALETLRLLTNLESEESKLCQLVFLAQPELDERLNAKHLRQLKQRIGFGFELNALEADQINIYLKRRLLSAGHHSGEVFSLEASRLLFAKSLGIPRVINMIAYKALLAAYMKNEKIIDRAIMQMAIEDGKEVIDSCLVKQTSFFSRKEIWLVILLMIVVIILLVLLWIR